jgi:crotonobetainyl-CoA:carnitine CoA-transferase CaiB-like acyl-CoA transferase
VIASPIRYSDATATYAAPPMLGEHTEDILTGLLGKTPGEVAQLHDSGAI